MDPHNTIRPLAGKVVTVFKRDAKRSTVWLEANGSVEQVIKRFEASPIKQMFLALLQIHPGQCEKRTHNKLKAMQVPVVTVDTMIWQGGKCCLTTAHVGSSLDRAVMAGAFSSPTTRHQLAKQLGQLTGLLLARKLFFRDLKLSNIVQGSNDALMLIDAGSVRHVCQRTLTTCMIRMLRLLEKTVSEAISQSPSPRLLTGTDRLRFAKAMLGELSESRATAMRQALGLMRKI